MTMFYCRYMDGAHGVVCNLANQRVFVSGRHSNSIAVVDVSIPAHPSLLGGAIDNTYLDGPLYFEYDPINNYLFIPCYDNARMTIVSVADSSAPKVVSSLRINRTMGCGSAAAGTRFKWRSWASRRSLARIWSCIRTKPKTKTRKWTRRTK